MISRMVLNRYSQKEKNEAELSKQRRSQEASRRNQQLRQERIEGYKQHGIATLHRFVTKKDNKDRKVRLPERHAWEKDREIAVPTFKR